MSNGGTSKLNNYLQSAGRLTALSWIDSVSGPSHAPTWTSVCKIDGVARGTGTGSHKHVARDQAAEEALQSLAST